MTLNLKLNNAIKSTRISRDICETLIRMIFFPVPYKNMMLKLSSVLQMVAGADFIVLLQHIAVYNLIFDMDPRM